MKTNKSLLLVLAIFFTLASSAQNKIIHFSSGPVSAVPNINQHTLDSFNLKAFQNNKAFAVIQFSELPSDAVRKNLAAAGIELLEYIPEHAYTVSISRRLSLEILQNAGALSLLQLLPEQKIEGRLKGDIPAWASKIPGTVDLWISFPKTYSVEEVTKSLQQFNVELLSTELSAYRIVALRVGTNRVRDLATQPYVEYVQLAPRGDQTLNFHSRYSSRATLLNASIADGGKGLKGEGVVVGVGDNADPQNHIDFTGGRIISRSPMPVTSAHGYHVTGTIVGGGLRNESFKGFAPKAKVISQGFSGILINAPKYVNDYNMVITNNSYGDNIECYYYGAYDLASRMMDQMVFDLPHLTHFFSSGNSGSSVCAPYPASFHTVLGGYQSAKNVITVGATTDVGVVAGFSSRGPVKDGRIKPEIVTQGQQLLSTWTANAYSSNNGTSMASPCAAGGMALLYQRYRQLHGNADPLNGLMKALLCNGASDRGNNGPDFQYGFGWMNLLRSIDMMENDHYVIDNVAASGLNQHVINVPANTAMLKVMLYWNDPAASPLSAKTLVNDLDLEVVNGATTYLPNIVDTFDLNGVSFTGVDSRNNMEQVVIMNPAAGTYTINVKGTAITQNGSQDYFVVYDPIPVQVKITSPVANEPILPSVDALSRVKIGWEAYGFPTGTVTIEFSDDNGANWSAIATGIDINSIVYNWFVPNVSTTEALIRITKEGTGETTTSGLFTIMPEPTVTVASTQCEGYFTINWTAVAGATGYEVMMAKDGEMEVVASTSASTFTYTLSGLSKDSVYWATVRPVMNGKPGRRGVAMTRQPNNGTCAGSISDNDLKIDSIIAPVSGRRFTSTQPGAATQVSVRIKNLDDAAVTGFDVKYSVNGGPFVTESVGATIPAGGTYTHTFATTVDLSAVGDYDFVFVVKNNTPDPVESNDTAMKRVRHLDNQPIDLSGDFVDDFESAPEASYIRDTMGLTGLSRYDFSRSTIYGRARTFVNSGMAYSGNKALTLDVSRYHPAGNTSYLIGTFNLVNYNVNADDVRLDFYYNNHGQFPHADNRVWIRGSDVDPWIEVYDLSADQNDPGTYKRSYSIELSDILAANGQSFTPSFQVRWGQWGQYQATDLTIGGGYTFDNIRIYRAVNDLRMESIDEPRASNCALSNASVISVTVHNTSNATITNIPVKYRVNGGAWVTENIPAIAANNFVQYNFTTTADLSALGTHTIDAVVDFAGDSFRENDTVSVTIVNSPIISSFPHIEDFENGVGSWYTGGSRSTWEYGTPASLKIVGAASGAKAWKTRLAGHYNDNEHSYLYSPCYDISAMTNPTLSFSVVLDIEDCGATFCDGAWVEYSDDGVSWNKLGAFGSGTNWYNNPTDEMWSVENYLNWHVATIPLPVGLNNLRLRFVMSSDGGVNREGIAIDDIHIYDNVHGIYDGVTMGAPVSATVSGNNWIDFTSGGKLVASVNPNNMILGATDVQAYINNGAVRHTATQYYHDRNITIKPVNTSLSDSVTVRFYFLDTEVDTLLKATGCPGCTKPSSAYKLGVSKYTDSDKNFENGTIGDNHQGIWSFIPPSSLRIVPFDQGYYAEFKVKDFSEFWLNNGGITATQPLPIKLMSFTAQRSGQNASLTWTIASESNVDVYEIEVARGNEALQTGAWSKIGEVASLGNTTSMRTYQFLDVEDNKFGVRYYRLKTVDLDGSFSYSPLRSVLFDDAILWQVYPNPSNGVFQLVYQLPVQEMLTARVLDAKGSLVQEFQRSGNGQPQKMLVDLTMQPAGVYLLEIRARDQKKAMKLYKR